MKKRLMLLLVFLTVVFTLAGCENVTINIYNEGPELNEDVPEDAEEAVTDVQDGVQSETPETDKENGESEGTERPAVNDEEPSA